MNVDEFADKVKNFVAASVAVINEMKETMDPAVRGRLHSMKIVVFFATGHFFIAYTVIFATYFGDEGAQDFTLLPDRNFGGLWIVAAAVGVLLYLSKGWRFVLSCVVVAYSLLISISPGCYFLQHEGWCMMWEVGGPILEMGEGSFARAQEVYTVWNELLNNPYVLGQFGEDTRVRYKRVALVLASVWLPVGIYFAVTGSDDPESQENSE